MKATVDRLADLGSIAAALSAVAVAGVVVTNGLEDPSAAPTRPIGVVDDWQEYAAIGHRRGSGTPTVTIVEFGDYQCPFCKIAAEDLDRILSQYAGEVALVYRHLPLAGHDRAYPAAQAAECASQQGRFWPFHDLLYTDENWMVSRS